MSTSAKTQMSLFAKASLFIAALMMGLPAVSTTASAKTGLTAKKICKPHSAGGTGVKWTIISARARARQDWSKRGKQAFGWKWASWALAKNRSYSCRRVGTKWRCKAKAHPCRL